MDLKKLKPFAERIELLTNGEGGENEQLIFKILKRGAKLRLEEKNVDQLVDLGLRYDLTVPLVRFYANNRHQLPYPFRSIQIGPVWRADRPQKGRFRQFYQCDIDIIGDRSILAEIQLMLVASEALQKVGFQKHTIRFNDRRILIGLADAAGVKTEERDPFFIILDKMDKIGVDGVIGECYKNGFQPNQVSAFFQTIDRIRALDDLSAQISLLPKSISSEVIESFRNIFETVEKQLKEGARIIFDPTLVRGMGYYTGPIYEVDSDEFSGAIAGGGRYDEKCQPNIFLTQSLAVGISIGFERILSILQEKNIRIPQKKEKLAIVYPKDLSTSEYSQLMQQLRTWKEEGFEVTLIEQKRHMNRQLNQLRNRGYHYFVKYNEGEKRIIHS